MGQRVDFENVEAFAQKVLQRLEGQQHYHVIDFPGGGSADVLRVLPGSVSDGLLAKMKVVFVERGNACIASVREVRLAGAARDLVLHPFRTLNEKEGLTGTVVQLGTSLVYGVVHRHLAYVPRSGTNDHPRWRPRFLPVLR